MVSILEKSEHNVDFHPIVDFVEASPLMIETTEEGTQILATVDGILRTVTESSLRRNLKLQDEEGIRSLPDAELFENLTLMGYNISPNQKFTFQKDEPVSPLRDISQGEACPTDSGFEADQDRANIAKTSTLPYDSAPRVTSPAAAEGRLVGERSKDDAPIKRRNLDEGEVATKRVSDDTEEMATVLTSMDAATVLASGVAEVPTSIFITATVVTPYRRRKGKEIMVESETPKKKKVARDAEIARIHAKEELYQDNYAKVHKYQSQQRKPWSKKQKRDYYMVWKQLEDFIPMGSKKEAERLKRKGLSLEQQSVKRFKTSEEVTEEAKSPDEVPEEKKLYDTCGVHHVTAKDKEIFMLVEKDYPLRKGLAIGMISYKLQVENYSRMENDLILKIYKIASTPRQNKMHKAFSLPVIEFPLAEEVLTTSEEIYHC
nr:hypothetical protein [Tanacetum cinerariifolium]